jgi:hypothetical protein
MGSKELVLRVPEEYTADPWLTSAKPQELSVVLDLAARLPRIVSGEKNELAEKLALAQRAGIDLCTKKFLEDASAKAKSDLSGEIARLEADATTWKKKAYEYETLLREEVRRATEIQTKYDSSVAMRESQENHSKDIMDLKIQAMKQELAFHHRQEFELLRRSRDEAVQDCTTLRDTLAAQVRDAAQREECALQGEREKFQQELQNKTREFEFKCAEADVVRLQAIQHERNAAVEMQAKIGEQYRAVADEKMALVAQVGELKQRIGDLEKPMGRGNSGECDVDDTLSNSVHNFTVEDTSKGEQKMQGYLDRLVSKQLPDGTILRLAVEVKNKATLRKQTDTNVGKNGVQDDLQTFQKRVSDGVRNNLFDAAVLVSIRQHTKMGSPVVLQMFQDEDGNPIIPVSYIGPEQSNKPSPLTQGQLETHVAMMFCIMERCQALKVEMSKNMTDETISSFQMLFEDMGIHMNDTFVELKTQGDLIEKMSTTLNNIRIKCIHMFRRMYAVNDQIPWLKQKSVHAEWLHAYETYSLHSRKLGKNPGWKKISKQQQNSIKYLGKDAVDRMINAEPGIDEPSCSEAVDGESAEVAEPLVDKPPSKKRRVVTNREAASSSD